MFNGLNSAVSETTGCALCLVQSVGELPVGVFVARYYQLGDALAVVYGECLVGEVDEDNADFAAIVRIDCTGRVQNGYAALERQSAAWSHLCLHPFGQSHEESCGHEHTLHGFYTDGFAEIGTQVQPCGQLCSVSWQGVM